MREVSNEIPGCKTPECRNRRYVAYFEIVSASGGVRLNIKGDNHQIVLQSEVYESKAGAKNAIEEIQIGAAQAPVKDET